MKYDDDYGDHDKLVTFDIEIVRDRLDRISSTAEELIGVLENDV